MNLQEIKLLKKHWIWMTLAGGTDPLLHPQIHFEDNDRITFTRQGYDLWTYNLNEYYTGTIWEKREKALNRFEKDLFGKIRKCLRDELCNMKMPNFDELE